MAPWAKPRTGRYLSFSEREDIAIELAKGTGIRTIASKPGRSPSTISREVRRNAATRSGRMDYRPGTAQWHADRAARRPRASKLDFYRKRWIIEEYFRTLKSAGFRIEDARMSDPKAFMNFVALAAIAAVTVTRMLRARDNPSGQALADAFDPDDKSLLLAICKDYEGEAPTQRQKNPHPPDTLAFVTWIIARLGAWTGYYGKPGPATLSRGLRRYHEIKYGAQISERIV
jgi:hypothetical protein